MIGSIPHVHSESNNVHSVKYKSWFPFQTQAVSKTIIHKEFNKKTNLHEYKLALGRIRHKHSWSLSIPETTTNHTNRTMSKLITEVI